MLLGCMDSDVFNKFASLPKSSQSILRAARSPERRAGACRLFGQKSFCMHAENMTQKEGTQQTLASSSP